MNNPQPKAELVITRSFVGSPRLFIRAYSPAAQAWIDKEARKFGYPAKTANNARTLLISHPHDIDEVEAYLLSYLGE